MQFFVSPFSYADMLHTKSVVLMAVAANDNNASALTPDTEEGSETSRCFLLEFVTTVSDVKLLKLGQWEFEGPATGDGFYAEQDGWSTASFFWSCFDNVFL